MIENNSNQRPILLTNIPEGRKSSKLRDGVECISTWNTIYLKMVNQ